MKRIYIELGRPCREERSYQALVNDFQKKHYELLELTEESWKASDTDLKESLIITDRQSTVKKASERNIACAGYEISGKTIYHADMVVQGFDELDAEFFLRVYRRHFGLPWTIAQTERLLIRESIPEDFHALYSIYQEPGITAYMPGLPGTKEEERETFQAYISHMYPFYGYGMWTVIEGSSGKIIGRAGLENAEYQGESILELGYMISREYQRQGYGMESVRAILHYGFAELGAEKIYARIHENNRESLRLIEKLSFQEIRRDQKEIRVFCR